MIVYSSRERAASAPVVLSELRRELETLARCPSPSLDGVRSLLVALGEFEAAVVDALSPDGDGPRPPSAALRRASLDMGHALHHSWRRTGQALRWLERLRGSLAALPELTHLPSLTVRVPEGFAYYALYPEAYLLAAARFLSGRDRADAVVIGIRSIGTALSGVVGAALEEAGWTVESWTVRPRGHPFDRRVHLEPALAESLWRRAGAHFLIIDEGPGLSGSSFASVAAALSNLGVPDDHIGFFPSSLPDPDRLVSEEARRRWRRHQAWTAPFEDIWPRESSPSTGTLTEVSGGAWRPLVFPNESLYPAVHPQHERRKYLRAEAKGGRVLLKFEGLGAYGRRKRDRAERLHEAGFAPRPLGLDQGFLETEFVEARRAPGAIDAALVETAARYLAFLRREFPDGPARPECLLEMIRVNVEEGLGPPWSRSLTRLERALPAIAGEMAVALDGRMLAHEWVLSARGWLKADALDHHDDHFFPGCHDICWDLAGFAIEFALDDGQRAVFTQRYEALSGDREVGRRWPFYEVAYLAFRLGYTTLAARTLETSPDGDRFAALSGRYAARLRRALSA
jgi:hypothetical protein